MDAKITLLSAQDEQHLQEIASRFHQQTEATPSYATALITSAMEAPNPLAGVLKFSVRRSAGRLLRADFVGHALLERPTRKNAPMSYGMSTTNARTITLGVSRGKFVGLELLDALSHAYPVPDLVVRFLLCDGANFPREFLSACVERLRKFSPLAVLQLSKGGVHAGHFGPGGFQDKHADRLVPFP
ncbi:MAG: hypothetical protein QM817_30315 [Archangium sp.]